MNNLPHITSEERLKTFSQLLDSVPFEQVISWVFAAPEPRRSGWWKRWWRKT